MTINNKDEDEDIDTINQQPTIKNTNKSIYAIIIFIWMHKTMSLLG